MNETDTKSDLLANQEKKSLEQLTLKIDQIGQDRKERSEAAAIITMMLKENPRLLQYKEGRELFSKCMPHVKGSEWEEILFGGKDAETEKFLKAIRETMEDAEKERERMGENFYRYEGDKMIFVDQAKQK